MTDRRGDARRRKPGPSAGASRRDATSGQPVAAARSSAGDGGSQGSARPRSTTGRWRRDELPEVERTQAQERYDGPPIPDDVTGKELGNLLTNQLKSLPEKLAARVARHLVAAARLLDSDPQTAYEHTLAARARAARVAIVREASGEAAYAAGNFKAALGEFKTARRLSGGSIYLPMMADCERALGRPERALSLAKDPAVHGLDDSGQIEMKIVESGARRDLGDTAAAIRTLEGRELRTQTRAAWAARLRYAYAAALLDDGQREAAREWFERAAGVDFDDQTDAAQRLAQLDGLDIVDLEVHHD